MDVSLIIAAAGKGERAGFKENKLFFDLGDLKVIEKTVNAFLKTGLIKHYIIAAAKEDLDAIKKNFPDFTVVTGGKTRTESVKNALKAVKDEIVLIHDGARPFVSERIIKDCINSAINYGSGIAAVPVSDTVCAADNGEITDYIGKSGLFDIQTPQGFSTEKIKKAYEISDGVFNDDGEVYKNAFGSVRLIAGDKNNIKLTFPEDFIRARSFSEIRFGTGFDCHKLAENRKLILGGVEIPHRKGLLGHSDADVLTHAIMDALLSACALKDIGYHFPDDDPRYKDADSMKLLEKTLSLIGEKGFKVQSVSAVIMAEKPKLLPHIPNIARNLADALKIEKEKVGIGATTLEGLGFVGREEGICVRATAIVVKN